MNKSYLLRSFMFLPAYNIKFIQKALDSKADAIILDMEDSVPCDKKDEGRSVIKLFAAQDSFKNKTVFIRVNEIGTKDFVDDISELMIDGIDGFMLPKISNEQDIIFMDRLLSFFETKYGICPNSYAIAPLIETTSALSNIDQIAQASKRIVALCFGGEDYLNDLGSVFTYQESAFTVPRAMIVNAARSHGLLPIDTPYLNVGDLDGFESRANIAYRNGFSGCLIVNPKQIEVANKAFMPDENQINHARRVLDVVENAKCDNGGSIVMLDGGMIGPPMLKRAQSIINQCKLLERYNG